YLLRVVKPEIHGQVEKGAHLSGLVHIAKGARIRSGAYVVGPVIIGEDSDIGPNCFIRPHTSIGRNVRVGNACELKNSIIMNGTHVGHLSYVGDSILGEGCNLGAGTIVANLRFDNKTVKMEMKSKIVDTRRTKMGIIFGDNVKTGVGTLFMPGVKVGCNSWIGPNIVVKKDVTSNTILTLKQQLERTDL
ncbi:MAG: glucose-1-phosphate thymidylyltransferase, partial [Asgard group archaeon]|nr:glucose-1-phosphate thymidylyltransferase [Asgard group archaeon]